MRPTDSHPLDGCTLLTILNFLGRGQGPWKPDGSSTYMHCTAYFAIKPCEPVATARVSIPRSTQHLVQVATHVYTNPIPNSKPIPLGCHCKLSRTLAKDEPQRTENRLRLASSPHLVVVVVSIPESQTLTMLGDRQPVLPPSPLFSHCRAELLELCLNEFQTEPNLPLCPLTLQAATDEMLKPTGTQTKPVHAQLCSPRPSNRVSTAMLYKPTGYNCNPTLCLTVF